MKPLLSVIATLGVLTTLASVALSQEPQKATVRYACVLFDHKDNATVFEGKIELIQFQKWFKKDYAVGGERVEVPKDASVIGALVLTDGNEILVMPLQTWGTANDRHFACQSSAIGKAPMFSVLTSTQKELIEKMEAALKAMK